MKKRIVKMVVPVTPELRDKIIIAANAAGMKRSAYANALLQKAMKEESNDK